jgi:hypothetical protein
LAATARLAALVAIALQLGVVVWAAREWLIASEALGRGIALAVVSVAVLAFLLSGIPAAILIARKRRPVLALALSLAFPLVWVALMSVA